MCWLLIAVIWRVRKHWTAFRELAREIGPAAVLETESGRIDIDWLARNARNTHQGDGRHELSTVEGRGFRFESQTFDEESLSFRLITLLTSREHLPQGWLRCKGVFDTRTGPRLVNADTRGDQATLEWADVPGDSGGSRMELLVPAQSAVDWDAVRAGIQASSVSAEHASAGKETG